MSILNHYKQKAEELKRLQLEKEFYANQNQVIPCKHNTAFEKIFDSVLKSINPNFGLVELNTELNAKGFYLFEQRYAPKNLVPFNGFTLFRKKNKGFDKLCLLEIPLFVESLKKEDVDSFLLKIIEIIENPMHQT